MKRAGYCLVFLVILLGGCKGKTIPKREIYNEDFKWTITLPENFEQVNEEEWARMQHKGADAIEQTIGEQVINQAKTIFVFKSDKMNYFESNYQPFDTLTDGDYLTSWRMVNDILYETFKTQVPDVKIDTVKNVENIDGLEFQTFKIRAEYPNKMVLNILMFSRLFNKREFTVNISFMDKAKGAQMLQAWKESKFGKQ